MIIKNFKDSYRGWFVGNFDQAAFREQRFEVACQKHKKGYISEKHYHKHSYEINLILYGKIKINGETIVSTNDIFIVEPNEKISGEFLEDTQLVIVRTASLPWDKFTE